MTKWDRLLVQLDKELGFEDWNRSTVKKRRQAFDEKTGEHVFILEYRVVKVEHADPKVRREKGIERRNNKYQVGKLLQDIHAITQLSGLPRAGTADGDFPDHQVPDSGELLQDIHAITQLSGLARVGTADGDFPDYQVPD